MQFYYGPDFRGRGENQSKMNIETGMYCPKEHEWTTVGISLLSGPYAYCPECDKIYVFRPIELKKNEVEITGRHEEMKELAKIVAAKKRVTKTQLIQLGLL